MTASARAPAAQLQSGLIVTSLPFSRFYQFAFGPKRPKPRPGEILRPLVSYRLLRFSLDLSDRNGRDLIPVQLLIELGNAPCLELIPSVNRNLHRATGFLIQFHGLR